MSSKDNHHTDRCSLMLHADKTRLKIRGVLPLSGTPDGSCEVQRGMLALSLESEIAGSVAALAVDTASGLVEFIILGHLPQATGYQAVPSGQVMKADSHSIWLRMHSDEIAALQVCTTDYL
ncbi:MAG: hypothetical protein ACM3PY_14495 [Omnitrophica WOR_2 bacterium]